MQKEFVEGEYTVTVTASPDDSRDEGLRFRSDVVIRRATSGEVVHSFIRYVAAIRGTLQLADAIRHGEQEARQIIEAGFPRD